MTDIPETTGYIAAVTHDKPALPSSKIKAKYEPLPNGDSATRAAETILADMMTRKGFIELWDTVELPTKYYAVEAWAKIIRGMHR